MVDLSSWFFVCLPEGNLLENPWTVGCIWFDGRLNPGFMWGRMGKIPNSTFQWLELMDCDHHPQYVKDYITPRELSTYGLSWNCSYKTGLHCSGVAMSHLSNVRFSTADLMFKVSNMGRLPSEKFSFRMVTSFWEGVPLVVVGLYLHKAYSSIPKLHFQRY